MVLMVLVLMLTAVAVLPPGEVSAAGGWWRGFLRFEEHGVVLHRHVHANSAQPPAPSARSPTRASLV